MNHFDCLVVGAGHAAAQFCESLRSHDWSGSMAVVGDEPFLPYHRPPLSKTHLVSDDPPPLQLIRPEAFYADHDIALLKGCTATKIDRTAKTITLDDHEDASPKTLSYEHLVLATGSLHRRPPITGIDHPAVLSLRTAQEATAIRDRLQTAQRVVVIGAGFIGLEAAASLRKSGVQVTVLEQAERVLSRVTSVEVSDFFAALHRRQGVDLQTGVRVNAIEEAPDGLRVITQDGTAHSADFVVMGAGAMANTALATDAGLAVDNGVIVDAFNRTEDPAIYAMGDCCNQHHPLYNARLRFESVQNATDQAKTAAAAIAGTPTAHDALPWFWSDEYAVKLQIVGLSTGHDRRVLRRDPAREDSFSVWYLRSDEQGERLLAVDAINDTRAYAVGSRVIPARQCPDPALIADPAADPRALLQSAQNTS